MTKTFTKKEAVAYFRLWYQDLKAGNGGKANRWAAWDEFVRVNVAQGHLPEKAKEWVTP